jgi:hypothetical protein
MLGGMTPPRIRYNVFIERAQLEAMRQVKERDGIFPAEQIRRAIDLWIAKKGVKVKADRPRAQTRKRS